MEIGPTRAICGAPHHPYTRALLSAVPQLDPGKRKARMILKGDIPTAIDPPSGCVFRTRCPLAIAACADPVPMRELSPGHWSGCIRDDIPASAAPAAGP
jgi:peptide/nickel transport system ATP-binding protein